MVATSLVLALGGAWAGATHGSPVAQPTRGYFKTPSRNIVCGYWIYTGARAAKSGVGCRIKSGLKPPPSNVKPGCFSRDELSILAGGRTIVGWSFCPGEPEGDAGVFAFESLARVLAYGKTWSGAGVRCTSQFTGLTCRNRSGHGFFLSRQRWRTF